MKENNEIDTREVVIRVDNVKKSFKSYKDKATSFKERFVNPSRGKHEDVMVLKGISFEVHKGEAIGIIGKNGCGKSSLFRLILGEQTEAAGKIWRGLGLKISYVSQDTSHLRGSLREYARAFQVEEHLICALLRKLDFSREQLEKPLEALSQGQKKKVLIARSLCEQAHLYLWDEPLNYVDVYSRIQIQELILKFQPTMVFVEHDAEFADRVADQILMMNPATGRSQIRY